MEKKIFPVYQEEGGETYQLLAVHKFEEENSCGLEVTTLRLYLVNNTRLEVTEERAGTSGGHMSNTWTYDEQVYSVGSVQEYTEYVFSFRERGCLEWDAGEPFGERLK